MFSKKLLIPVLALAWCAVPASASSLTTFCVPGPSCTYANNGAASSAFTTATSGDTFSNLNITQGALGTTYTDASGLVFTDPLGMNGGLEPSGWPVGTAIISNAGVGTLTVTLPTAVNAIEFYAGTQNFSNFTIAVTDSTGGTFSSGFFTQASTGLTVPLFFGAETTSNFTTFTITSQAGSDLLTLDDISIGTSGSSDPAETPEAATFLMVAGGLFLMRFGRRWIPGRLAS